MPLLALFRLAFASAPAVPALALPHRLTRRLILQKARGHARFPRRSHRLSANGFRVYFTPLTGVLFTFPSRYWSAIGRQEYLALEGGPPCFPQD
jgi:hypothetical protein